jgi:phosphatidylethanolamine-binding protein (PEBP) family uncharacterized protein
MTVIGAAAFWALLSLPPASSAQTFQLQSADVAADRAIPQTFAFNGFGCTGQNTSPALSWSNAPAATKSFAVMVHDADAVTGGAGFWHWAIINLPAGSTGLALTAQANAEPMRLLTGEQLLSQYGANLEVV